MNEFEKSVAKIESTLKEVLETLASGAPTWKLNELPKTEKKEDSDFDDWFDPSARIAEDRRVLAELPVSAVRSSIESALGMRGFQDLIRTEPGEIHATAEEIAEIEGGGCAAEQAEQIVLRYRRGFDGRIPQPLEFLVRNVERRLLPAQMLDVYNAVLQDLQSEDEDWTYSAHLPADEYLSKAIELLPTQQPGAASPRQCREWLSATLGPRLCEGLFTKAVAPGPIAEHVVQRGTWRYSSGGYGGYQKAPGVLPEPVSGTPEIVVYLADVATRELGRDEVMKVARNILDDLRTGRAKWTDLSTDERPSDFWVITKIQQGLAMEPPRAVEWLRQQLREQWAKLPVPEDKIPDLATFLIECRQQDVSSESLYKEHPSWAPTYRPSGLPDEVSPVVRNLYAWMSRNL